MVKQDKDKYNTPKYRLVARFTNRQCIAQIVYATLEGDMCLESANSLELPKYGVKVGLKNYSAAYCVGLLLARRVLKKLGIDDDFKGVDEVTGEVDSDFGDSDRRPFKAVLDVGLKRTTVGSKVFALLKGAVDGGVNVPHSEKRFYGYKAGDGDAEGEYDAEAHKERILGGHVCDYMEHMKEEDPQMYEKHFAKFIEAEVEGDDLEDMYKKAHEAIKEDPEREEKEPWSGKNERRGNQIVVEGGTNYQRKIKLTCKDRKARVANKIRRAQQAAMEED